MVGMKFGDNARRYRWLSATCYFKDIDYSKIEFADQLLRDGATSIETRGNEHVQHYDFSNSLLAYTSSYWLGITIDHLLALNKTFADDATYPHLKFIMYGGIKFDLHKRTRLQIDKSFTVSFFIKTRQIFNN